MRLAERMSNIGTETAFEVSARARALEAAGRDIIHLQIGEPDFDTPANVRDAAKRALDQGVTHYAPYPGIPQLREAIADDATARKGFPVTADRVFVTVGGKGVMLYAILGLVDPGDEVLVPDPGYPIYESLTRFVGGTPVPVPIRMEHDFRIDLDELASLVTPRTRMLVINSPANPTGGVLTRSDLEAIAELATRHDLVVLADEIYGRILYDGEEHVSIASLTGMAEGTRVVLPSPNGATLSLTDTQARVLAGCLRNAAAVAREAESLGRRIGVIAAGELWSDGTPRPCLEDWLGAGAIIHHLAGSLSPEAEAARATFRQLGPDLASLLRECGSGRELCERGYSEDVALAAALDVSEVVPVLEGGAYRRLGKILAPS